MEDKARNVEHNNLIEQMKTQLLPTSSDKATSQSHKDVKNSTGASFLDDEFEQDSKRALLSVNAIQERGGGLEDMEDALTDPNEELKERQHHVLKTFSKMKIMGNLAKEKNRSKKTPGKNDFLFCLIVVNLR